MIKKRVSAVLNKILLFNSWEYWKKSSQKLPKNNIINIRIKKNSHYYGFLEYCLKGKKRKRIKNHEKIKK